MKLWLVSLALGTTAFGIPLTFDFNSPPPWPDSNGTPVTFTPVTFPTGSWISNGGNPGGYIRHALTSNIDHPLGGNFSTGIVTNINNDRDDIFFMFGPNEPSPTISFDYRTTLLIPSNIPITSRFWRLGLSVEGSGTSYSGTFPLTPDDHVNWSNVIIPVNQTIFSAFPSDPLAQSSLIASFNIFSISLQNVVSMPIGSVTFTLDMDNLTFGTPVPEPNSLALVLVGILAAIGCSAKRFGFSPKTRL